MTGMPTPYSEPSSLSSLMCTGFFGFGGLVGLVEVELPPEPVASGPPLPCPVVTSEGLVPPLPLDPQALRTRAAAARTRIAAPLRRRLFGFSTPLR